MSRFNKLLSLSILILFILACNTVTQPFSDAQNLAGTAQAFASEMPIETLQAMASEIPVETLQALPSAQPTFEALASAVGTCMDPQGAPVTEWNGIPVMPQATAGQDCPDLKSYIYKVDATVKDAEQFYNDELPKLGWNVLPFGGSSTDNLVVIVSQKDNSFLTVTITETNGNVLVTLLMV